TRSARRITSRRPPTSCKPTVSKRARRLLPTRPGWARSGSRSDPWKPPSPPPGGEREGGSLLGERVLRAAQRQAHRHGPAVEVLADRIDQVALVARRQVVEAGAEDHEARRAGLDLGDVAQLDPPPAGRGRRIGLERLVEPAVERRGRYPATPLLAQLERGAEHLVEPLAGHRRDG